MNLENDYTCIHGKMPDQRCVECQSPSAASAEERLAALREYVRQQTTVAVPAHEAGGINQVNFRLGMAKAYRDIEKRLMEMEGK